MNISVVLCIQDYAHKCLFNALWLMKIEAMKMSPLILSSLYHTNLFESYIAPLEESVSDFSESKQQTTISPFLMGMLSLSSLLLHYCILHCHRHWKFDPCISGGRLHIGVKYHTIQQCFTPISFEQGQMLRQRTAGSIGLSNFTELRKANIWESCGHCLKYLSGRWTPHSL